MALHFYNTMSRRKELFKSIEPKHVRIYTCGPTVYNFAHIGNFRAYIFEDQVRRYLKFKGYKVTQVMNLTDVDDKIIRKCYETQTPLDTYTKTYKEAFFQDIATLNIDKAEHYPEATTHIPEMVALIKSLLQNGLAYKTEDGNIFFRISSFEAYGKLQRIDKTNLRKGQRVESDEYSKESLQDFALWKAWKPEDGDVFWETELGKGRPGWHIECSAMSMKYLGESFDIHTGGVDNIFPHHENEIAQSEGATGKKFVNYWLHCDHLLFGDEKMSKSLGNITYIKDLAEKGYSPRAIRFMLLSTHYRQKLLFTEELLQNNVKSLERIDDFLFELEQIHLEGDTSQAIVKASETMLSGFEEAMDDDLNISRALGTLFECIREVYKIRENQALTIGDAKHILPALQKVDQVLGVIFWRENKERINEADIQKAIERRYQARREKNWKLADEIRDELKKKGIELIDRKEGTTWRSI
jgi:cysteinyl-tRNA synthetase